MENHTDTIILGAGIAGLTAAYKAKKENKKVLLIEASSRTGGIIQSVRIKDHLLELGPNTVMPTTEIMSLISDLNLENDMVIAPAKIPRYIQFNNKLHPLPLSPLSLFSSSLLSFPGKARFFMEPFIKNGKNHKDESLGEFIERRFGTEITNRLLKPFVSGMWAGNADHLSAKSSFPELKEWEHQKGSLLKGALTKKRNQTLPRGLLSFKNGLDTLVKKLSAFLKDEIKLNQEGAKIEREKSEWVIQTDKEKYKAKNLISTLPAYKAATLFQDVSPQASQALNDIPYVPMILLHLSIPKDQVEHNLNGFGYLVCPDENSSILGCLWNSSLFENRAPQGQCLLTVFMGGAMQPERIDKSDEELLTNATKELEKAIGLKEQPTLLKLTRYKKAIPQYTIGHLHRQETLEKVEKEFQNLSFIGNYKNGISVGDVIKNAQNFVLS